MLNSTCNDEICCYLLRCRDGMGVRGGAATRQFAPMGAAGQLSPPQASPSSRRPVNLLPWRVIMARAADNLRMAGKVSQGKLAREQRSTSSWLHSSQHRSTQHGAGPSLARPATRRLRGVSYNKMGNVTVPH